MDEYRNDILKLKLPDNFKLDLSTPEPDTFPDQDFIKANMIRKTPLTLEAISQREGVSLADIPNRFRAVVDQIPGYIDPQTLPIIDNIYNYYAATRDLPSNHQLARFAHTLDTFDDFATSYLAGRSLKTQGEIVEQIDDFITHVVHPSKILTVDSRNADHPRSRHAVLKSLGIYNVKGQWIRTFSSEYNDLREFVEMDVIREVGGLIESGGLPIEDLYHESTSMALDGISEHRAVLSSYEAKKRGLIIKSGEYVTKVGWGNISPQGEMEGLGNIYASLRITLAYMKMRWFNEFPVVLGLSKLGVIDHFKNKGVKTPYLADWAGEGVRLGPDLPLSVVKSAYTYHRYIPDLLRWTSQQIPSAWTASLEAAQIIKPNTDVSSLVKSPSVVMR